MAIASDDVEPVEVIWAIANVIEADSTIRYSAGGEGVFEAVESVDIDSATLIFTGTDGNPYEVRVRRMTQADCAIDRDGIVPPPIMPKDG